MGKKKVEEKAEEIPLPNPNEGTVVCVVSEFVGANYLKAICMDGKERFVRIPGKLRHKVWINIKDVVLVSKWEFDDNKGDILYRYSKEEKKKLIDGKYLDPALIEGLGE